ncbi:MAG: HigA family addiction module antitoxin [Chitinophagales bacterium]
MNIYKVLNKKGKEIQSDVLLHPGDVLLMELEAREIKKSDFALLLEMRPSHFSELLHGKRHVSANIAIKLENALDISAEFWMRVQTAYDIKVERQKLQFV